MLGVVILDVGRLEGAMKYQRGNLGSTKVEHTRPCVGWFALKNGKLDLLGLACHSQVPVRDPNSRIEKVQSLSQDAHPVLMLYGYMAIAPIVRFNEYLLETNGIRPTKSFSKSSTYAEKGCRRLSIRPIRNDKYDITGEAQLNEDCIYEADQIDLILLSERRRIDRYKAVDLGLGYKILLVK